MEPLEKILESALLIAREALAELGVDPQHWDYRGSLERLCRHLEEYHAH